MLDTVFCINLYSFFFFKDKSIAYMQINKCTHTTYSIYVGMYVFMHIYCKHTGKKRGHYYYFFMFLCSSSLHLIDQKYRQDQ